MNQKLTPPSPERQALVTEYARQVNSGEYQAGYWKWLVKWDKQGFVNHYATPAFHVNAAHRVT